MRRTNIILAACAMALAAACVISVRRGMTQQPAAEAATAAPGDTTAATRQ